MSSPDALDQLQQVQELNRAFLGLLQARVREDGACLGLPLRAQPEVAAADGPLLEGVAGFPRVLFTIKMASPPAGGEPPRLDETEHDLCLTILLAARHASRQSPYQARLLFGLDAADVERLRTAPLAALQRLAGTPGVVQCAFSEQPWFWYGLFTATRPELRRQVMLMALQPALAWPQRRPPQAGT